MPIMLIANKSHSQFARLAYNSHIGIVLLILKIFPYRNEAGDQSYPDSKKQLIEEKRNQAGKKIPPKIQLGNHDTSVGRDKINDGSDNQQADNGRNHPVNHPLHQKWASDKKVGTAHQSHDVDTLPAGVDSQTNGVEGN